MILRRYLNGNSLLECGEHSQIRDRLSTLGLGEVTIQEFGKETDALVRIQRQDGAEEQMTAINKVKDRLGSEFEYRRTEFVGPTVGKELKRLE